MKRTIFGSLEQAVVNYRVWKEKYVNARNAQQEIDPFEMYLDIALIFEGLADTLERLAAKDD